ncbi:MAG: hypothetical protein ACFFDB_06135 [Promethearchaeota archaeon]
MIFLSNISWIHGISAIFVIIIRCSFGFFLMYKSRKTGAKLLFYTGLAIALVSFQYFNITNDFLTILLTGNNSNLPDLVQFFISWMWPPLSAVIVLYIATELLFPEKKWYFIPIYLILLSIVYLAFIIDPAGNTEWIYPSVPGEDLIEGYVVSGSVSSLAIYIMMFFTIAFNIIGTFVKGVQSTDLIRKKFWALSLGWGLSILFVMLEGYSPPGAYSVLIKLGMISSLWFLYYGLREEPEKSIREITEKDIKVEEGLFRLIQRPTDITEEEVSISKEKKICLICKGKVGGISFICTECGSFYCETCVQALITLENVCWVCNTPIDPSKPSQPYKKKKETRETDKKGYHE